tara:strand:+ start:2174 stop:3379 length:1206 start_codon:yes stop_codon:yes gene_type:complete
MNKKNKIVFGKLNQMRNDRIFKNNKIRIGFIGGGPNSFIGYTHRLAARFDNRFTCVAGVFSRNKIKSKEFAVSLGIDPSRAYSNYKEMIQLEKKRVDSLEAVGIMTPAGDHFGIASEFIKNNIHVICDKPLTATLKDAYKLKKQVKEKKIIFALTHNYSAYPMLREAREIIKAGKIGKIRLINVEYPQGYTAGIKKSNEKSTLKWRLDSSQVGPSMILAEIGTHAHHLLRYVTDLEINEISAEVKSLSSELTVDDNAFVLLRLSNKASGMIWVSSAATGGENGLRIRVFGSEGAIDWLQDEPNSIKYFPLNLPSQVLTRGSSYLSDYSIQSSRLAAGHPEGFFEAFSNIYTEFAEAIIDKKYKNNFDLSFPTIDDGVKGIEFIFAAKKSSMNNGRWIKIKN